MSLHRQKCAARKKKTCLTFYSGISCKNMWFFKTQFLHEKKISSYFHFFFMCTLSFMYKEAKKNACKICRCLKCNRHINCMWFEQWIFYTFPCEHETCAYFVYNGMVHFCHIIFVDCFFHKNIEYLHMKNIFVTQHL